MNREPPVLSIITVTSMGIRDLILRSLRSIYERAAPDLPLEVFVVDNASNDGTVQAIREQFPQVTVIENELNVGFSPANNQALALARGEYVLFLNPDTEVGEGTLQACVAALENDASIGMVGCRIMYPDGRVQYEGGRRAYTVSQIVWESLYLHMFFPSHPVFAAQVMGDWDHRDTRDVEALSGAFMFVRREIANRLGGLPTEVFLYHEDHSFCLRVRRLGYRIRYLGDVEMIHYTNQSTKRSTARWGLLEGEVKTRLVRENQGAVAAFAARMVLAARCVLRMGITVVGMLPGFARVRQRYPRVFHFQAHVLLLVWCLAPWAVKDLMPRAGAKPAARPSLQPAVPAAG